MTAALKTTHEDLLRFWLAEGFKFRMRDSKEMQANPKAYKARMQMEWGVISGVEGYVDYFLMVSDLVRWAKDNGIMVGAGRGSAAGSLCCWLLRITEMDPMLYPMLFERFLDPTRTDPPDIDIDFEDERRLEVIAYAQQKYGFDRVANILTFTRYKGKNSLDDIARVYRIPESTIGQIKSKLVERADGHPRFALTLRDTYDSNDDIAELVKKTPELELATKLEGIGKDNNIRTAGIHPCGIVIGGTTLTDVTAMYEKQSGTDRGSGVAYDKKDSEYLGLLKVDFLSLTTLSAVRTTLDHIVDHTKSVLYNVGMSIDDYYRIPLDDPKVYEAFRAGDVLGIFQFEGRTTRMILKQVAPTKFMDLVDVNALSRPGGDDKAYIAAKNSGQMPELNPAAAQHVTWTHGTIVYQEQILLILRDYGNFPVTDVNRVRKIISAKEDQSVLNEYFQRFAEGAATHGDTAEQASVVWRQILAATGYAFNISHAACYSDLAYRQMWLKVYHPEFYLGQLLKCPTDKEGLERRRKLIVEAEQERTYRKPIHVRGVSLLESKQNWSLHKGELVAGFTAIHGIGQVNADKIVAYRDMLLDTSTNGELLVDVAENHMYTGGMLKWEDLLEVDGIGPGRLEKIQSFSESDDPFGVLKTKRILDACRQDFDNGEFPGVNPPTHNSLEIVEPDEFVTFMGILKARQYKDTVSQRLKYGGEGLTRESILEGLSEPTLLKYATLDCDDEYDEPVRLRISRTKFPKYRSLIAHARLGIDVVVASGYVTDYGGMAIQVSDLVIIDPEEEAESQ